MNVLLVNLLFLPLLSAVVLAAPPMLTYQGRILKTDGTPLEAGNVSFLFKITDPSGACIIYQEQINGRDMTNSGGVFDVPIGSGSVQYPTTGTFSLLDAFNNSASLICSGGSTYHPLDTDGRLLRVAFYDGGGWKTVSPDTVIRSVPFAGYSLSAQKLGTNSASDFVLKNTINGNSTCNSGNFLTWDASTMSFGCAAVSGGAGGTVTSVSSANSDIGVASGTTTPVLTLNSGTGANQILKLDGSSKIPAVDGSQVTNLNPTHLSAVVPVTKGGTGQSSFTDGQLLIGNSTGNTLTPATLTAGTGVSVTNGNGSITIATTGLQSSTLADGKILVGNSSNVATAVSASQDISMTDTGAVTVTGVKGKSVSAAPTATGQVLRYDGSSWTPNFVGMLDLRSKVTGTQALASSCTAAQTLTYDSVSDNLTCSNIAISGSQVTYTSQAQNTFLAAPSGSAGTPSFRTITTTDLPSSITDGLWGAASGNVYRSSGNVGIGTTSPTSKLHVHGVIKITDTFSGVGKTIGANGSMLEIKNNDNGSMTFNNLAGNSFYFYQGAAARFFIDGSGDISMSGNVGIGTTVATEKLDVAGNVKGTGLCIGADCRSVWPSGGGVTSVTGSAPISVASGTTTPVISISPADTSTDGYLSSTDWNTFNGKQSPATTLAGYGITDAIKNAGNTVSIQSGLNAAKPAASLDGKIYIATDTHEIYRDNGTTWVKIASASGSGTVTSVSSANSDISVANGTTTPVLTLNSGTGADQILKLDGSSKIPAVDGSQVTNLNPASLSTVVPVTKGGTGQSSFTDGQLLIGNTTGNTLTKATLTAGSGVSVTNGNGSITIATTGLQSSTLADGKILIGNSSNVATAVTPSQDISMTDTGAVTVTGVKGKSVSAAPTAAGQVLRYDGTNWTPNFVGMLDLRSKVTGTQALASSCSAAQTLTYSSVLDNLTCSNIAIAGSQVTYTSQAQNTFLAAPSGSAGAPSFRTIAATDLPTSVTDGLWTAASGNVYRSSGNVGVGTTAPDSSALLDLNSTTKGFLPPRMTTGQRASISSPAEGLIVFDTDLKAPFIYKSATWVRLSDTTEVSFSASKTSDQAVSAGSWTKVTWEATSFNVGGGFDLTNDKFQPSVPGKYLITFKAGTSTWSSSGYWQIGIMKNGSLIQEGWATYPGVSVQAVTETSALVDLNGSTDEIAFYVYPSVSGQSVGSPSYYTVVQGYLISGGTGGSGGGADNMGNHVALQNVSMANHWLSGDGDDEGVFVSTAGNVGIGTTSPGAKLHVGGTAGVDGIMFPDGTLQTSAAVSAGTNNTMLSGVPDAIACENGTYRLILYYDNNSSTTVTYHPAQSSAATSYNVQYSISTGAYVGNANLATYDCVTSAYSLSQLKAAGRSWNFAKGPAAQWLQSGSDAYYNAGNVGIGTASPAQKLSVAGTIESTSGGVKYPDGNTQTSAFQKTMTIRKNQPGDFFLANGGSIGYTASCVAGEIATGGGCGDSGHKMFYQMIPSPAGYSCYWYNTSGAGVTITGATVYVNCLK